MDNRRRIFWLIAVEGILCLVLLLIIPYDPKNAWILGFSPSRLLIAFGLLLAILVSLWLGFNIQRDTNLGREVRAFMDGSTTHKSLARGAAFLLLAGISGAVFFLVAWISIYPRYAAYFLRLSPAVLFVGLASLQGFKALKVYHADLWNRTRRFQSQINQLNHKYKIALILSALLFLLVGMRYHQLAEYHARVVNHYPQFSDQDSVSGYRRARLQDGFPIQRGPEPHPAFPLYISSFLPARDDKGIFFRAQPAGQYLSVAHPADRYLFCHKKIYPALAVPAADNHCGSEYIRLQGWLCPT